MNALLGKVIGRLALGVCAVLLPLAGLALEPVRTSGERHEAPALMLETGVHIGMINRIDVDPAGQWLVSASNDKTIRVWDVASGRLVKILRPPTGEGKNGMVYAVAISPDGRQVAAGGWFASPQGGYEVLIFDRESGRVISRIAGLPQIVLHLDYSPDGRHLAVAMAQQGLRIHDVRSGRLIASESTFGRFGIEFIDFNATSDKLVATDHQGMVGVFRLLPEGLVKLVVKKLPGGQMPRMARFSPDGRMIAVGFDDTTVVNVVDSETLAPVISPQTPISGGTLSSVAWSVDGDTLYAAGEWNGTDGYLLRKWHKGGRGTYIDIPLGQAPVVDLRDVPGSGLIFANKHGNLARLDSQGGVQVFGGEAVVRFVQDRQSFRISHQGERIQFRLNSNGQLPHVLNIATGVMIKDVASDLLPPRGEAPGISLSRWESGAAPRLNGRTLGIREGDTVRAVAISPDASVVVIGAEWTLYAFNRAGKMLWQESVPAAVVGVGVAGDGRHLVAMLDDGTLRWLRVSDGNEMLRVFLHADGQRWLAWTPAGDYDASPAGESLFGWYREVGKASEQELLPAATFRAARYKPGLAQSVLGISSPGAPAPAVVLAAQAPAKATSQPTPPPAPPAAGTGTTASSPFSSIGSSRPRLQIISPEDNGKQSSQEIVVRYAVETPADAPIKTVYAVVNDQTVSFPVSRTLEVASARWRELKLTIPPHDSEIMIFAENNHGLGPPAILRLKWGGN